VARERGDGDVGREEVGATDTYECEVHHETDSSNSRCWPSRWPAPAMPRGPVPRRAAAERDQLGPESRGARRPLKACASARR
jgi:hypothetical protein